MKKQIKNNSDYIAHTDGYIISTKTGEEKVMVGGHTSGGYPQVCLRTNGQQTQHLVHRLIAEAFIDNPCGHKEVNHIDGDKTNNAANNLEWCDRSHNMKHAYKIGCWGNQYTGVKV